MPSNSDWMNQFIGQLQAINQDSNAAVQMQIPNFSNVGGTGTPGALSYFKSNPVPLADVSGGPNPFERITDILLRPLYGLSNTLTASVADIKGMMNGEGANYNPLEAGLEGITGKNKGTYIDTAKALGLPNQLANVLGTVANLYGDPANAVAGGLKLGLKTGVRAATKGKAITKSGQAAQAATGYQNAAQQARAAAQAQTAAQQAQQVNAIFNAQGAATQAANKNLGSLPGMSPGASGGMGGTSPVAQVLNNIGSNASVPTGKYGVGATGIPTTPTSPNVTAAWAPGMSVKSLVDQLAEAGQISDIKALPAGTGIEPPTPRFTAGIRDIEDAFATPETKAAYKGVIDDALNSVGTRTTAMGNISSPYRPEVQKILDEDVPAASTPPLEGLRFVHVPSVGEAYPGYRMPDQIHAIMTLPHNGKEMTVGQLHFVPKGDDRYYPGEIAGISVTPGFKRMGIARAMVEEANRVSGPVYHSSELTSQGKGFAAGTPEFNPPKNYEKQYEKHLEEHGSDVPFTYKEMNIARRNPQSQADFVARYKDILDPKDFAALQRTRSPEAFAEVAQNILNRTKPQSYESLNEFLQAAYHKEIPDEEIQKVLDAAGVSNLSELTKAYKRAGGSPTSKLKPHIPDPSEEPAVTIHPETQTVPEQPAPPVAGQVADDLAYVRAMRGTEQIDDINNVANSTPTPEDAIHVEQIKANKGAPLNDRAQGIRANQVLREETDKLKNISYRPAEATKAAGMRVYERLATVENEERLAGTSHTFTAPGATESRYIGLSDVLHLLGQLGTSKYFVNFKTKLTGETLGKMGAAAVDGHKAGLEGDALTKHIIDAGVAADRAAPVVGKGRNLGSTLTSINEVAGRLGKYADILADKEAVNASVYNDVVNKAAGSVVRDTMNKLTEDLGETGITANAVEDVADIPGMVSKNAGNNEAVKNAAGVTTAEHVAKMVDPSDILASKTRVKNAKTINGGKSYSTKPNAPRASATTGTPGPTPSPSTSAPGTPPTPGPVGPKTAPVPGPTVVNGTKVANNLNATARQTAQQMNRIANQNMVGHYPPGMTPLDQIDIDFANQQNLLAAKNANPIWALLGAWAGKGYQLADEAVRGRVAGTTTIVGFDKVITQEFNGVHPDVINEAFAGLQGGYWPTDPNVAKVTERLRYYADRAGMDTSHMPGTPSTTQPLVGSVWGGPYQDADIIKAMVAAKIHPSAFTPTPAQAALMAGMSPRQMMSATYRYATIEKPLEFIQKHNGAQVNLGYQQAIGAHFSAQFASPTRLPGYVRIDELKMPKGKDTHFHQYIARSDVNGAPLYYPKEAVQWMTETEKIFNMATSFSDSSGAIGKFINNNMDPLIGAWKFLITAARPGFVVKNFIGDVLLSMGAGVRGIKPYTNAFQVLKAGGHFDPLTADKIAARLGDPAVSAPVGSLRITVPLKNGRTAVLNDHQIYNLAYQQGVLPSFLLSEGVLEAKALAEGTKGLKKMSDKLLSTKYAQGMGWLSEQSSYLPRLAQFISHLQDAKFAGKYGDLRELAGAAANNVRKYHPDVTGLAPGGQKYMRRLYPFYSWNRLTLPTIVEMALTKPTTITALPKLQYGINQMLGSDSTNPSQQWPVTRLLPNYIRDTLGEVGGNYTFNAGTPSETLSDFITGGVRGTALNMLNPALKIPLDLMSGTNIGNGAPITDVNEYIGQQIPGVQQVQDLTGTDIVGSLHNLVTGQGALDPLRSVQTGKRNQFNGLTIANFLLGLGIKDVSNVGNDGNNYLALKEINGRG